VSYRVVVIGCGRMGSVIAREIACLSPDSHLILADKDVSRVRRLASEIGADRIEGVYLNASRVGDIGRVMKGADVAIGALPSKYGYNCLLGAIKAGVNLVDISYVEEDPLALNRRAKERGIIIVPDCGLAPGLSNLLIGRACSTMDEVKEARIYVGGLPQLPRPPLNYSVTWSLEDLIEEYTRKVRILINGEVREVPPLSGLEKVDLFPEVGELEAFYTDGLRTMLRLRRKVGNMFEKTLRYPGHASKFKTLYELGFLDDKEVEVEGHKISARKFTERVLEEHLASKDPRDLVLLFVEAIGKRGGKARGLKFRLVEKFREEKKVTAMSELVSFMASTVSKLILDGEIKKRGVIPPEDLGMELDIFWKLMEELKKRVEFELEER
jgi:lysine 6-dehydrogenase